MMTVNDSVMKALYDLGYRGSYNDRVLSHMKDELGVTNINEGYYKAGGFGKYVESLLSPVINYIARLDGVSQRWQLSGSIVIPASADCAIGFTLNGSNDSYEGLFRSGDGSDWFRLIPESQGSNFQGNVGGSFIGGVPYSSLKVRDGSDRKFVLRRVGNRFYIDVDEQSFTLSSSSGEFAIDVLCEFGGDEFGGYIKDFYVDIGGTLTHSIPLTNKDQGATQLATVGTVNATMPNYTPDVWEVDNASS